MLACVTLLASSPLLAMPLRGAASEPPPCALLHAVLNVKDITGAARFFVEAYGAQLTRSRPGNAFVAFGSESGGQHFAIEFSPLDNVPAPADSFGGLVFAVDNPAAAVSRALAAGARRDGGGERCAGDAYTGCAVVGPEGVRVAFVKGGSRAPRFARLVLRVVDTGAAATVLKRLGFDAVKRQQGVSDRALEDAPPPPAVLMGRGDGGGTLIELRSLPSGARNKTTSAATLLDKIAVSVPAGELEAYAASAADGGATVVRAPFAVPGIGTHVALVETQGVTLALVDAADFEKELI
jgi:predicted enzyme related to lactoylglutathione lyase